MKEARITILGLKAHFVRMTSKMLLEIFKTAVGYSPRYRRQYSKTSGSYDLGSDFIWQQGLSVVIHETLLARWYVDNILRPDILSRRTPSLYLNMIILGCNHFY